MAALVPRQIPLRAQDRAVGNICRSRIENRGEQGFAQAVIGKQIGDLVHQRVHATGPVGRAADHVLEGEIQPDGQHLGGFAQRPRCIAQIDNGLPEIRESRPLGQGRDAGRTVGFRARIDQRQGTVVGLTAAQDFICDQAVAGLFGQLLDHGRCGNVFCSGGPRRPQIVAGGHHVIGKRQRFMRRHRTARAAQGQQPVNRTSGVGDDVGRAGIRLSFDGAAKLARALGTGQIGAENVPVAALAQVPCIHIPQHGRINGGLGLPCRQAAVDIGDDTVGQIHP